MDQIQLINAVRLWERRLEINNEKQQNRKIRSYADSQIELQLLQKHSKNFFARILKPNKDRQSDCTCYTQENCFETQQC